MFSFVAFFRSLLFSSGHDLSLLEKNPNIYHRDPSGCCDHVRMADSNSELNANANQVMADESSDGKQGILETNSISNVV